MYLVNYVYLPIILLSAVLFVGCISVFFIENVPKVSAICANDLSGKWVGNDGGTYYIKQNGNRVWWAGSSDFSTGTGFTNVFDGNKDDNGVIKGKWFDVPLGNNRGNGELSLQCNQDKDNDILTTTSATGGFGGSFWSKSKEIFKKYFGWNNINRGDCTLITAYIDLYSNGKGVWHADVTSDSDDDSWVVRNMVITDANGNHLFTIPRFSSPTLTGGPLPFAYGSNLEEDKIRWWNNANIQFPFELFDRIGGASLSSHC